MPRRPVGRLLDTLTRRHVWWGIEHDPRDGGIVTVVLLPPDYPGHYLLETGANPHAALLAAIRALESFPHDPET